MPIKPSTAIPVSSDCSCNSLNAGTTWSAAKDAKKVEESEELEEDVVEEAFPEDLQESLNESLSLREKTNIKKRNALYSRLMDKWFK